MKTSDGFNQKIAIMGSGNIGQSIAKGLLKSRKIKPYQLTLTRKHVELLDEFKKRGCLVTDNNIAAVQWADIIVLAVRPEQSTSLLSGIKEYLNTQKHILVSPMTGISIKKIKELTSEDITVIRAMPNTAISVGESMTCIAGSSNDEKAVSQVKEIFDLLGKTMIIEEKSMTEATVLCACGIAYFLRIIRAISQGGIEIGFHPNEAIAIAAQTAKGASTLLLTSKKHPEEEVDKVTTPRGITIAGLNQMEHEGLSSAVIKGILASAEMAKKIMSNFS